VLLESDDLGAITEIWCYESHDWSVAIDGYRLFGRNRQGRRSRGVAHNVKKWTDCEELPCKNNHEWVESSWVRIRDQGNKKNYAVGVYYMPPDQGEPIEETLLQLQEASRSQAFIMLGDFNHPNICWKSSMVSCRQSRKLLECIEDNFLSQVIDSPTRGNAILDLLVTKLKELICDVKLRGSLGCSDHALVEFAVLRDVGQMKRKVRTPNFGKANFQLFKKFVNRTPWETALRNKGTEQSWQTFKDAFHKMLSISMCKKSGKKGETLAWMSGDLLAKLKAKKEMHRQWKQGQVSWKEY